GGAGVGMHARARDGGDIDDRAVRGAKLADQPFRQQRDGEQVDVEDTEPVRVGAVEDAEPLAVRAFRRNASVVDEDIEFPIRQAPLHLLDAMRKRIEIAEIELQMILRSGGPRATLGERLARNGDDTPAVVAEPLRGGVAYAAAGAGENQDTLTIAHCGI